MNVQFSQHLRVTVICHLVSLALVKVLLCADSFSNLYIQESNILGESYPQNFVIPFYIITLNLSANTLIAIKCLKGDSDFIYMHIFNYLINYTFLENINFAMCKLNLVPFNPFIHSFIY